MLKVLLASAVFVFGAAASAQAGFLDDLGSALDNAVKDVGQAIEGGESEKKHKEKDRKMVPVEKNTPSTAHKFKVTEEEFWGEMRFQWGQYLNPEDVYFLEADVTCDGHNDYIASRMNRDNPDGPFYNIMVVTREGGNLASEAVSLSFDSTQQEALCGSENIEVSVEHWDEGQIDAAMGGWEGICTEAIKVDDGMCDAPRYFWRTNLSAEDNHPRLMFFRN